VAMGNQWMQGGPARCLHRFRSKSADAASPCEWHNGCTSRRPIAEKDLLIRPVRAPLGIRTRNLRSRIRTYAEIRGCPYLLVRRGGVSTNVRCNSFESGLLSVKMAADFKDLRELGQLELKVQSETVARIDFEEFGVN
jgi:hypothetical protein